MHAHFTAEAVDIHRAELQRSSREARLAHEAREAERDQARETARAVPRSAPGPSRRHVAGSTAASRSPD